MKRVILTTAFLSLLYCTFAPPARAICLREGCQRLEIRVDRCDEKTVSNRDDITEFLTNLPSDDAKRQEWMGKIIEFEGLEISGAVLSAQQVPCAPDDTYSANWPVKYSSGDSGRFFYRSPGERCDALDDSITAALVPRCCDTLPPEGDCVIRLPLLESAKGSSSSGDGSGGGGKGKTRQPERDGGRSGTMLPEKGLMFDRR